MDRFTCVALFLFLTLQVALPEDQSRLASVSAKPLEVFDSLNPAPPPTPGGAQTDTQAIYGLLLKMVDRWNAHDIEGYMEAFWNSPDLWCVVGADTFFGYGELYAAYQRGYVNRDDMGTLTPERVQIRKLTTDIAIALTWWTVRIHNRSTYLTATIDLRKFQEGWKVVASHTTFLEQ
jgi:hypothetical protein